MFVYFISDGTDIKIGFTSDQPESRMADLQTGNPNKLKLIGYILGDRSVEYWLHTKFNRYRKTGEWFTLPGDIVAMIEELPKYTQNTLLLIAQDFYGFDRMFIPLITIENVDTELSEHQLYVIQYLTDKNKPIALNLIVRQRYFLNQKMRTKDVKPIIDSLIDKFINFVPNEGYTIKPI